MKETITSDPRYDIRYTRLLDKTPLKEWVMHPEVLKWFPMNNEKEVDLLLRNWIGYSRFESSLTAIFDHKPIGIATLFLMPYKKVAHESMFKIVVSPEYQRRGIGSSLLKNIKHLAQQRFRLERLHVEVYAENPLIVVLENKGFILLCGKSIILNMMLDTQQECY